MQSLSKGLVLLITGSILGFMLLPNASIPNASIPNASIEPRPFDVGTMLKACAQSWQYHLRPVVEKRPWLNPARAALVA